MSQLHNIIIISIAGLIMAIILYIYNGTSTIPVDKSDMTTLPAESYYPDSLNLGFKFTTSAAIRCPEISESRTECVVPEETAKKICNDTPECVGYVLRTTSKLPISQLKPGRSTWSNSVMAMPVNILPHDEEKPELGYVFMKRGVTVDKVPAAAAEYYGYEPNRTRYGYAGGETTVAIPCERDSLADGFCLLTEDAAKDLCAKTKSCVGYVVANRDRWNGRIRDGTFPVREYEVLAVPVANYPDTPDVAVPANIYQFMKKVKTGYDRKPPPAPEYTYHETWEERASAVSNRPNLTTYIIPCPAETKARGACIVEEDVAKSICRGNKYCWGYLKGRAATLKALGNYTWKEGAGINDDVIMTMPMADKYLRNAATTAPITGDLLKFHVRSDKL